MGCPNGNLVSQDRSSQDWPNPVKTGQVILDQVKLSQLGRITSRFDRSSQVGIG